VLSDAFEKQANVLTVLTAESLARLGRFSMAEGAFRDAILADPSLAVAYKNLGDLARASGRYPLGWACYDAFQLVSPEHPYNQQINAMKNAFRTGYPSFF
jgi:tetratricopeptide (TPR) repeat protein